MIKRPKPGDTEEDLLQEQNEFIKSQQSAEAVRVTEDSTKRKPVTRDIITLPETSELQESCPAKKTRLVSNDLPAVLSVITERTPTDVVSFPGSTAPLGFPSVTHRGPTQQASVKKQSIFAQQLARESASKPQPSPSLAQTNLSGSVLTTSVLSEKDQRDIHEENLTTLSTMSEEEILFEQKKLREMLDPQIVSYLQLRRSGRAQDIVDLEGHRPTEVKRSPTSSSKPESRTVEFSDMSESQRRDLPIQVESKWVNMTSVQPDKLRWMSDLPRPKADKKGGSQARFDFTGHVITDDTDPSVTQGLHHHGDEPSRPGYTLEEIFQLIRSTNLQQRVSSLNLLAKIIRNAYKGELISSVQKPIIPSLLEAGVIFLLRWSLDDSTDSVIAATVNALHAVLVDTPAQDAIWRTFSWHRGYEMPVMCPVAMVTEGDESDADLVKRDVIKGLLKMSLLARLTYILVTCRPQLQVVHNVLEILCRVCQHSPESAYKIYQSVELINWINLHSLPMPCQTEDNPMDFPDYRAMRLMKYMCSSGRNITSILNSKMDLLKKIMSYLTVRPSEMGLEEDAAYKLHIESLQTWTVCGLYGYGGQEFRYCIKLLQHLLTLTAR